MLQGTIDYPFAEQSEVIGKNTNEEKLVIRSTVGQAEYAVEIPGAARDYDIEVPLADLRKVGASTGIDMTDGSGISKPQTTDKEYIKDMPKIIDPDDRSLVEGAFGLGHNDGPRQSPSYTLRIAKINKLYLARQFEYALIEINNLLTYYPTSVKLYKMKGTLHMKMRSFNLAEQAWSRAFELAPSDSTLQKALASLRQHIFESQQQNNASNQATQVSQ